ncbi:putative exodeoxyribonuclease V [Streptomyces sp. W007]|nr:putative exodeoxyribonuclease V [Streptomyces sp. W007]
MAVLEGVLVSTSIAVRIYKKYEDASISVVKNQPYRLAADVWGAVPRGRRTGHGCLPGPLPPGRAVPRRLQ